MLGRAKSCRWQVFVRRRPPKQGELRTDVSKATMFQGDRGLRPSGLPGTIQISARYEISAEMTGGTCRNRFCLQNGGEEALNRCERVTAVQTQDRCFSKKKRCTASSQYVFIDKICGCTLVWVRCEIVAAVRREKVFLYQ